MASRPKLAVAGQKKASKYTIKDGFDAVNTKQLKKAKTIFSELVAMNRTDPDANFGLALVFMQEGDWDKAARIIKSVLPHTDRKDIHDTYTSVLYNLHLKNGWKAVATAPEKSAKEFLKAKKIKSDSPDVAEGLSYAYNNAKKPDLAIPYVLQTYKNKPNFKTAEMVIKTYLAAEKKLEAEKFFNTLDPLIQVNMEFNPNRDRAIKEIEGHLKENQYRQAMSKLREIYLMYPTDLKVLFYMGKAYAGQDKTKRALEYFKTVLKRKPDHKEALTEVAHIYMKDEKDEKALEILHVLQKANVKVDHFVEQIELRLFIKNKNYKEAEKLAKKMIANDPTNVKYYIILGDITKKDGRKRESYFYYAKAYQLEPNRFKVRMELLDLLLEQKLFDQVQIILEKFRGYEMTEDQTQELRTFYESYYKTYAAYSLGEEEYLDALRAAKAGLQMMPNDMGLMETAGWAGLNGKKYTDAVYFFKKIASQDLTAYSQRYGLGLAYVNMKQKNKALLAFQEAEQTQDRELLLKIAEIYKDIGEDKHAFRVIKRLEKQSSAPVGMPQTKTVKTNKSSRDDMNVYNPFLGSLVPTAQPEPATPSIGSNNLQTLQPNNPNNIMFTSPIQQPTSLKKKW
jgi:tetratricopeptide (TPR) repeat protein